MPHIAMAMSSSSEKSERWHKPGRTLVLAINHWTSCIIAQGTDTPLGRLSYIEFVGKSNTRLVILSAYQVCHQKFDAASDTASAQQIQILQANGEISPNPRQVFLTDLINQIKQWRSIGKEVLVCMDTNDQTDNLKAKIL